MSKLTTLLLATALMSASVSNNPAFGTIGIGNRKKLIPNRIGLNQRQKRKNNRRAIANGFTN